MPRLESCVQGADRFSPERGSVLYLELGRFRRNSKRKKRVGKEQLTFG